MNAIDKAISHVRKHHPTLSIVIFTTEGKWCYMDEDFNAIKFGDEISVSILEDAVNSVEDDLPYIVEILT